MKQLLPYLFLIVFLGILAAAVTYLARRLNWYFSIPNTRVLYYVFASLVVFMIAGVLAMSNSMSRLGSLVYIFAALTMGILLYLLLSVVVVDLVRLFTKFPPKTYGVLVLILTFSLGLYGTLNSWNIRVTHRDIPVKGLSEKVQIMHLSDIHLGHFRGGKFLQRIVDKTNHENPDIVVITGDLFDGRIRLGPETLAPLAQLKAPVYFIEGNHDNYTGVRQIKSLLRSQNIRVLENEMVSQGELQIIGLNHMLADHQSVNMHAAANGATIKSVLQSMKIEKDRPTILLHHSPDGIQYASEKGVDLYLAGHTHAGQLFPINYLAELLFRYNKGLHQYNGTKIFVSEGAGTFGPPMRVGTRSEISLITLMN